MARLDNPAGRLLELLTQLSEQQTNASVASGWAEVLEVDSAEVPLKLSEVARLVSDTQRKAEVTDPESLMPTFASYRDEWWKPVAPTDENLNGALNTVLPSEGAMNALRILSAYLSEAASEGLIPEDGQLSDLTEALQEAVAALREADDLPDPVRHAILDRLADIQRALDHIKFDGPDAVKLAMDALIGTIVTRTPTEARKSGAFKKVGKFFGLAWLVFMAGPNVDRALEAWTEDLPNQLTTEAEKVIEGKGKQLPAPDGVRPGKAKKGRAPSGEVAKPRNGDGSAPAEQTSPRK